jgi:integrase
MVQRLSDTIVDALKTPAKGNKITYDAEVKGFGARVTAAGARSFILNYYTTAGRERRWTIGQRPDWKTTAARKEAKRLRQEIDGGADPVGEQETERSAPTMVDLAERYLEEHAQKKRTADDDERIFKTKVLPALGAMKVADVEYSHVERLHRKITKQGRLHRANRVIATLSKAFNLSIRWKWRADNPCKGIERNPESKRVRYLSGAELAALTKALAELPDQEAANAIRLLLLTGARRGEVLGATWSQFDLESGAWTKPGHSTKQKTVHCIPLSAPARQLLSEMHKATKTDYVFPGRGSPHRIDLKKPWAAICKAAGLKNAHLHDLRHTYASMLASSGFSLPMIGALLGHTQPGTTARYAHLFDDPLRKATETVGAIVTGQPVADVVPIKRGA